MERIPDVLHPCRRKSALVCEETESSSEKSSLTPAWIVKAGKKPSPSPSGDLTILRDNELSFFADFSLSGCDPPSQLATGKTRTRFSSAYPPTAPSTTRTRSRCSLDCSAFRETRRPDYELLAQGGGSGVADDEREVATDDGIAS